MSATDEAVRSAQVTLWSAALALLRGDRRGATFLADDSSDPATARAAHLARVAKVKKSVTHSDPRGLLDRIRQAYDPADPATKERRVQVERNRSNTLKEQRRHG